MREDHEKQQGYDSEYLKAVKLSVENKSYFKDALDWYFFRYTRPIYERTILMISSIVSIFVVVIVVQMISSSFPLIERVPIVVAAKDQTTYYPRLIKLKKAEDGKEVNVDELVVRYLAEQYVVTREAHDYSTASIEDVNTKFSYIRNNSSADEYRNFQNVMSRDNPDSPLRYFGQPARKIVEIDSVQIIKDVKSGDLIAMARDFFKNIIPKEAEVRFTVITQIKDQPDVKERFLVKMSFNFSPVERLNDKDSGKKDGFLKFIVNKYQLFKITS